MTELLIITACLVAISLSIRDLRPILQRWIYYHKKGLDAFADAIIQDYIFEILFFGFIILACVSYILVVSALYLFQI